jgi:hypothetical protein
MMKEHVESEQIVRFRQGTLAPEEVLSVARHLAECDMCASKDQATYRELRDALVNEPRSRWAGILAAAAALVLIVSLTLVSFILLRRTPPAPPRVAHQPRSAAPIAAIHLERPAILAELRPPPGTLRGEEQAILGAMQPAGDVVEPAQPRFTWPATRGARYVVSVFQGQTLAVESNALDTNSWTPSRALTRGIIYTWQVEVRRGDALTVLPAPPAAAAMFRVLDESTFASIERVRHSTPNDHERLGVLYARAGVQQRAIEELGAANTPESRRLLEEVRAWP